MWSKRVLPTRLLLIVFGVFAFGCAGSAGSARPLIASSTPEVLARYTKVAFATSAQADASKMTAGDRERIVALIVTKLKAQAPNRFADLAAETADAETLHVTVAFTRYDEGSAFARFMLAGLGQIHISADVTVEDRQSQKVLGKSQVTKTFAWGGVYGGTIAIKDVEEGFAEAVAKVVLGQFEQ